MQSISVLVPLANAIILGYQTTRKCFFRDKNETDFINSVFGMINCWTTPFY